MVNPSCPGPVLKGMNPGFVMPASVNQTGSPDGSVAIPVQWGDCITVNSPMSGSSLNYMIWDSNSCHLSGSGVSVNSGPTSTSPLRFTVINPSNPGQVGGTVGSGQPVYLILQTADNTWLKSDPCGFYYLAGFNVNGTEYIVSIYSSENNEEVNRATWSLCTNYSDCMDPSTFPVTYGADISIVNNYNFYALYDNTQHSGYTPCGEFGLTDSGSGGPWDYTTMIINNSDCVVPLAETISQQCPNGLTCAGTNCNINGTTYTCKTGCTPSLNGCTVTCPDSCTSSTGACSLHEAMTIGLCTPSDACAPAVAGKTDPTDPAVCVNGGSPTCNPDGTLFVCASPANTSTTMWVILGISAAAAVILLLIFIFGWKKIFN